MNSKLSFSFAIQRIASLTNIWVQKYCLNTHHRQAQVVSLHKGSLQGFFAECISISPAKSTLMCKACTFSSLQTSSFILCHFFPAQSEKRDRVRGISRKNPCATVLETHTSVNQNLTLPTAHIDNKTSDFHSHRKLKHATPNSESSFRIREHENNKLTAPLTTFHEIR